MVDLQRYSHPFRTQEVGIGFFPFMFRCAIIAAYGPFRGVSVWNPASARWGDRYPLSEIPKNQWVGFRDSTGSVLPFTLKIVVGGGVIAEVRAAWL